MTIASEISRLQCAKADICTAIENKGVTVGNIALDCYSCCIDAISGGGGDNTFEVLVVGGGGAGGIGTNAGGGGGGGGAVIYCPHEKLQGDMVYVKIGEGGCGQRGANYGATGDDGGDSYFGDIVAYGGGGGGGYCSCYMSGCPCCLASNGRAGGNGGGASGRYCVIPGGCGIQGFNGGNNQCWVAQNIGAVAAGGTGGAGGGGAGGPGSNGPVGNACMEATGGDGGGAYISDISGEIDCYGAGGGGGIAHACLGSIGIGGPGGGCGVLRGDYCTASINCCEMVNAKKCGAGGGGASCNRSGTGGQGVVIVRYKTGAFNYTGGCKYECGDYTIHCFTSDGMFGNIGNTADVDFILIGGGGGGGNGHNSACCGGGGGGAGGVVICCGKTIAGESCVVIGAGGQGTSTDCESGTNGYDSCFAGVVAYGGGGGGGTMKGGTDGGSGGGGGSYTGCTLCAMCGPGGFDIRGQGCYGGKGGAYSPGGGGGAGGSGTNGANNVNAKLGGVGIENDFSGENCWYAGGGTGGGVYTSACVSCGGTLPETNATICGAGGGGARCTGSGNGGNGLLIVRYPNTCGYNITGGCKYECNGYCIHYFTSDGTLTVN